MLNPSALLQRGRDAHAEFVSAAPFPHAVFDNFLPDAVAQHVLAHFPTPQHMNPKLWQAHNQKAAIFPQNPAFPEALRPVLYALNSFEVIEFLEALTGIDGIVADPFFVGGGLQQTLPGGRLGMHVDFNHHAKLRLYRRINLLIYLNETWDEEWGGHLILADKEKTEKVRVLPAYNRCAVFETSAFSWHGHPTPLACPPGESRKSIALYYYAASQGDQVQDPHWTQFSQASDQGPQAEVPPNDWRHWAKQVIPPLGLSAARAIRRRLRQNPETPR